MKNYIIVLFVLIFNHSFGQLDAIDTGKYSIQFNKEFRSITHYSWFSEYLDTKKSNYDFLYCINDPYKSSNDKKYCYVRLNNYFDTLSKKVVTFRYPNYPIESLINIGNSFFIINSLKATMGEASNYFLAKYDSNWKRIWFKSINENISPDDNVVNVE